jgi:hypothetical protein
MRAASRAGFAATLISNGGRRRTGTSPRGAGGGISNPSTPTDTTMPLPNANETEREYVARCVPVLIGEGKKPDAAVAICHSMWDEHKKPKAAVSASAGYVLHLDDTAVGLPLPLGLEGLPTKDDAGEPIHYRRVKVAECGDWVHRGTGAPFDIARARADEWVKNTTALSESGHRPFVTPKHVFDETGTRFVEPDARDTLGYVERVERDGNDVYAVIGLHGDDALKVAAKNGRSVGVAKRDARDAKGNVFPGEYLHHLALCPNSALPGLGGMARSPLPQTARRAMFPFTSSRRLRPHWSLR